MGKAFWLDTETTGVDSEKAAIVQLAGVVEINGKPVEEINIRMKPFDGADIHPDALNVNKLTMEMVMGHPPWAKGMSKLTKTLDQYVDRYDKNDKLVVMGYRVDFDTDFLRAYFRRLGGDAARFGYGSRFFNCPVDVMSLVGLVVLEENLKLPNFKLETVCKFFGLEYDAHDALEDIKTTRKLYQLLRNRMASKTSIDRMKASLKVRAQEKAASPATGQAKLF